MPSRLLAEIIWSVCISISQIISFLLLFRRDSGSCNNRLFNVSILNLFLSKFPVDHLFHPVISSLLFFLSWFAAFAYYVVDLLQFCWVLSILAWYQRSLWRWFVLQLEVIQFLLKGFPLLATSKSYCLRLHLFVSWIIHTVVFLTFFVFVF